VVSFPVKIKMVNGKVLYRLISNCIDISPKCTRKITLVLRDMMSELFIVFLVLSGTEYESNYIVFGGIFLILFLITQIKSKNKIIRLPSFFSAYCARYVVKKVKFQLLAI
jgi:hypothetical protein